MATEAEIQEGLAEIETQLDRLCEAAPNITTPEETRDAIHTLAECLRAVFHLTFVEDEDGE